GFAGQRDEHAIDAAARELPGHVGFEGVAVVGEANEGVVAIEARHFFNTIDGLRKKLVVDLGYYHSNGMAELAAQAAGVGVGLVVQLGRHGLHAVLGFGADIGAVAQ
nr:hypothetical protein [Tanacetum cinerariifolium]